MLTSPMLGNVWKMLVEQGDSVQEGQLVCIIEAMKMENEIVAHRAGTVTEVHKAPGDSIRTGEPIVLIS